MDPRGLARLLPRRNRERMAGQRSFLRLVILTGDGLEHRFVTDALARAFSAELQAIVIARPGRRSPLRKLRGYLRRYRLRQLLSRLWARGYALLSGGRQRRLATYARYFSSNGGGDGRRSDLVRYVPSHNTEQCCGVVRELAPDVIAVYGTAVIKPPMIRLARQAILNMHTGLSPQYRGADTVFWALHNAEPQWVGVTVHLLDEGLDSGPIVRTGRPVIAPSDDEDSLFCKCVILGARLYVEAIREVTAGGRHYPPQDPRQGREYRFADRTVAAERRVRALLRGGLLHRFGEGGS